MKNTKVFINFRAIISSMRPEQWYKNLIIFVGIIFSLNLTTLSMLCRTIAAFGIFCILSSGVYLINDIHDAENDRLHPKKRNRPIASGELPKSLAEGLAVLFVTVSLASSSFILGGFFLIVCLIYLVQNLLYTFWLRSITIVDVAVVSTGFVWRAIAGTVVIGINASPWLITCSFLLALFLALLKREKEIAFMERAEEHRATLGSYSESLINTLLNITTASLLIAYIIYTFESKHVYMPTTIPFAFIGIFRYLQLARESNDYNNPTFIFRDRITLANMLLWGLTSIIALYELPQLLIKLVA